MKNKAWFIKVSLTILLASSINFCYAQKSMEEADSLAKDYTPTYSSSISDSGLIFLQGIIDFYSDNNRPCKKIKPLLKQGNIYSYRMGFGRALEFIIKAEKIFNEFHCSPQIKAEIDLSRSILYAKIGDFQTSDSIALNSIKYFDDKWSNTDVLIKFYLFINGQVPDKSDVLPYLDTAYQLAQKFQYPKDELAALLNLGAAHATIGSYKQANYFSKLALKVAIKINSIRDLPAIYINLAGTSENSIETSAYLDSALYYSKLNNNLFQRLNITENKAYFEYDRGNYQLAYNSLEQALELKDTLLNAEKYRAVAEMEQKFETEIKTNKITALELENAKTELEKNAYQRNQNSLLIGILVLLISAVLFASRFFTIRKNRNVLAQKNKEIEIERQRSEDLLLNILPSEIAEELKINGKAKAQNYDLVSILFTDFKQFTKISQTLSAQDLVEEMNVCFKAFDLICEKYSIEKIKTIGDAYMAAGGLTGKGKDSVKKTVLAGIEMQSFIKTRIAENKTLAKPAFEMRVGIHSGPVVAGIVGIKKFQYDLWGDTVNTASRIESHGEPFKVNISKTTHDLIVQNPEFEFADRGKIEAKGKGEIDMFFVKLKEV